MKIDARTLKAVVKVTNIKGIIKYKSHYRKLEWELYDSMTLRSNDLIKTKKINGYKKVWI